MDPKQSKAKFDVDGNPVLNIERWQSVASESASWLSRYQQIAKHIAPGDSVIEFGCGSEYLRTLLPAGCAYQPADVVQRSPETFVIDLLKHPPSSVGRVYDLAVYAGTLEYVFDPISVLRDTFRIARRIVFSYATVDAYPHIDERVVQHGWFSHLSLSDLLGGVDDLSSVAAVDGWRRQHIIVVDRSVRGS